jgi:hypothetical protein
MQKCDLTSRRRKGDEDTKLKESTGTRFPVLGKEYSSEVGDIREHMGR